MKIDVSGKPYNPVSYHVGREDSLVYVEEVERPVQKCGPRLIVAGWSIYPRLSGS